MEDAGLRFVVEVPRLSGFERNVLTALNDGAATLRPESEVVGAHTPEKAAYISRLEAIGLISRKTIEGEIWYNITTIGEQVERHLRSAASDVPLNEFISKTVKSATTFLERWQGCQARISEITSSHRTAHLVLSRGSAESDTGHLLIAIIDPQFISGPLAWQDARIVVVGSRLGRDEMEFIVHDVSAGFVAIGGSIEVKEFRGKER